MLALDTGFDQSTLICRDLHHGNSIKLLRSFTEVSATLEPFVKDNCKSGIGKKDSSEAGAVMECKCKSYLSHSFPFYSIILYSVLYLYFLFWQNHTQLWHIRKKAHLNDLSRNSLHLLRVTTPSSLMMLGWSNCPMIDASARKSRLCLSVYPPLRVLMATQISFLLGSFRRPLHTSPNSPKDKIMEDATWSYKCGYGYNHHHVSLRNDP